MDMDSGFSPWRFVHTILAAFGMPAVTFSSRISTLVRGWGRLAHSSARPSSFPPASSARATTRCGASSRPKSIFAFQGGPGSRAEARLSTVSSTAAAGPLTASSMGKLPVINPKKSVRNEIVMSFYRNRGRPRRSVGFVAPSHQLDVPGGGPQLDGLGKMAAVDHHDALRVEVAP